MDSKQNLNGKNHLHFDGENILSNLTTDCVKTTAHFLNVEKESEGQYDASTHHTNSDSKNDHKIDQNLSLDQGRD